MVNKPDRGGRI